MYLQCFIPTLLFPTSNFVMPLVYSNIYTDAVIPDRHVISVYFFLSGWRRLLLTSTYDSCAGEVYLQNETGFYAVSNDGWGKKESNELCKYLDCGQDTETRIEKQGNIPFWSKSYSCTGRSNIWDCEKEKAPVTNQHLGITCSGKGNLYHNSFEIYMDCILL